MKLLNNRKPPCKHPPPCGGKNGTIFQTEKAFFITVRMYIDWKRLRMVYDDKWDGLVQPVDGFIDSWDVLLNATKYYEAGVILIKLLIMK